MLQPRFLPQKEQKRWGHQPALSWPEVRDGLGTTWEDSRKRPHLKSEQTNSEQIKKITVPEKCHIVVVR